MSGAPDRLDANLQRLKALVRGDIEDANGGHVGIGGGGGQKGDAEWDVFSRILQRLGLR